jgi:hypothetical protein
MWKRGSNVILNIGGWLLVTTAQIVRDSGEIWIGVS